MVKSKFQEAADYLTKNPDEIFDAWNSPYEHVAGCLFQYMSPISPTKDEIGDFGFRTRPDMEFVGCLTQVRNGAYVAWTDELTKEIKNDDRIPCKGYDIRLDDLPVFVEWQERFEKEFVQA